MDAAGQPTASDIALRIVTEKPTTTGGGKIASAGLDANTQQQLVVWYAGVTDSHYHFPFLVSRFRWYSLARDVSAPAHPHPHPPPTHHTHRACMFGLVSESERVALCSVFVSLESVSKDLKQKNEALRVCGVEIIALRRQVKRLAQEMEVCRGKIKYELFSCAHY